MKITLLSRYRLFNMKHTLTLLTITTLLLLIMVGSGSATLSEEWNKTFRINENGHTLAKYVQQTSDGGYIVVGDFTDSSGPISAGSFNAFIAKTDKKGDIQWKNTFGDSKSGYHAWSVYQTKDNGYIIACTRGPGVSKAFIVKVDKNGNEEWNKTLANNAIARSVLQTSDDGYILSGSKNGDILLLKTDEKGTEEWNKTFGGSGIDSAKSLQITSDSGYIIAGETRSFGEGVQNVWLVKTDMDGNKEWSKIFSGKKGGRAFAESVIQTSDGGYVIAGLKDGDVWLIKTYQNGTEEWNKTIGEIEIGEKGNSVLQTLDGGYLIAGIKVGDSNYGLLIKTDSKGVEQWNKTFDGFGGEENKFELIQYTSDGGYIITGLTEETHKFDAWLIKIRGEESDDHVNPPSDISGFTALSFVLSLIIVFGMQNYRQK